MLIIKLSGGLGNQMFQYAYIKALSLKTGKQFALDIASYSNYFRPFELEIFDIQKKYARQDQLPRYERLYSQNRYINYFYYKIREVMRQYNPHHYIEHNLKFDTIFPSITNGYVEGYFQSEKYFLEYADEIKTEFTFRHQPNSQNQKIIDIIKKTNSVSIHIRRGDYLKGNNLNYHGICSLEYYQKAISCIQSKITDTTFFFFSDDIQWVKENLKTDNKDDIYIDQNTGDQSWEDMRLMSLCKHNIIANSSFSRWGAWLNQNTERIIIAPSKWFENKELDYSNIVPDNRIKI